MLLIGLGLAARRRRAQPGRGLCRLRPRRRTRRRLRLCSRGRRGAALVRPAPRLCLRSCRERIGVGTLVMPPLPRSSSTRWMARRYLASALSPRSSAREWRSCSRTIRATAASIPTVIRSGRAHPGAPERLRQRGDPLAAFMLLYAACLICSFGLFVPFVHLVPYAVDHGCRQSSAVLLLSVIGIGCTAGRFFLGGLADRIGRQSALLAAIHRHSDFVCDLAVSTMLWPLAGLRVRLRRDLRRLGRGVSRRRDRLFRWTPCQRHHRILYTSVAFGTLIGPSAAGFAFDLTHDLHAADPRRLLPPTSRRRHRRHVPRGPCNGRNWHSLMVAGGTRRHRITLH